MSTFWAPAVAQWRWMGVNWLLAVTPVLLAVLAGRSRWLQLGPARPLRWLLGAAALVLLPNTPYLLTDLRHLGTSVQELQDQAQGIRLAVLLTTMGLSYSALTLTGAGGYLLVLQLLRHRWRGWPPAARRGLELAVHGFCATGIWLGHTSTRANSWDLWQRPRWLLEQGWQALVTPTGLLVTPLLTVGLAVMSAVLGRAIRRTVRASSLGRQDLGGPGGTGTAAEPAVRDGGAGYPRPASSSAAADNRRARK